MEAHSKTANPDSVILILWYLDQNDDDDDDKTYKINLIWDSQNSITKCG